MYGAFGTHSQLDDVVYAVLMQDVLKLTKYVCQRILPTHLYTLQSYDDIEQCCGTPMVRRSYDRSLVACWRAIIANWTAVNTQRGTLTLRGPAGPVQFTVAGHHRLSNCHVFLFVRPNIFLLCYSNALTFHGIRSQSIDSNLTEILVAEAKRGGTSQAYKVLHVCSKLHLDAIGIISPSHTRFLRLDNSRPTASKVCQQLGEWAAAERRGMTALWWLVRSKDAVAITKQVDAILSGYVQTGLLPDHDAVMSLAPSIAICPRLAFLGQLMSTKLSNGMLMRVFGSQTHRVPD